MNRSRATKRQLEYMLTYLENNSELVKNCSTNKENAHEIQKKWEELTKKLNEIGTVKSLKQWKQVFSDMKINTRRKARELKKQQGGTGGGPSKVKNLNELEERVLALLHPVVVDGLPVGEVGLPLRDVGIDMPGEEDSFPMEGINVYLPVEEEVDTNVFEFGTEEYLEEEEEEPRSNKRKSATSTTTKLTNNEVLMKLTDSNRNIALAMNNIATAIFTLAEKIETSQK